LQEIPVEQVMKWDKGNELWATMLVELADKSSSLMDSYFSKGIPQQVKDLI
jgi:hypothetical protein